MIFKLIASPSVLPGSLEHSHADFDNFPQREALLSYLISSLNGMEAALAGNMRFLQQNIQQAYVEGQAEIHEDLESLG